MAPFIATTLASALAICASPQGGLPQNLDASALHEVVVQHNGRWMPMETLARDFVDQVTGDQEWGGEDPVLTFLAWTFAPDDWLEVPLITIKPAELRHEIQLPETQSVFSVQELGTHARLEALIGELSHTEGRKLNPLESKVSGINGKMIALSNVFYGNAFKPIPNPEDPMGPWVSVGTLNRSQDIALAPTRTAWIAMREAFAADDGAAFERAVADFKSALERLPSAYVVPPERIAAELRFNKLHPFFFAWILMGLGAVLAAMALAVRRRSFDAVVLAFIVLGWAMLSYGLWLRGTIAGRLPAANMYESLLFLSWGTGAFAILAMFFVRNRGVPLTAAAMGALSLCLADSLPMDQFIRPISPVLLDTVWMSIHVPIIMVSYSVLTLAVMVAHVQVFVMALAPKRGDLAENVDGAHAWYMHAGAILLFVGIVTGSMWAASSWGRYWGWDPKEVWSLVAFLGYMVIMHVRVSHEEVSGSSKLLAAGMGVLVVAFAVMKLPPVTLPKVVAFGAVLLAMGFFVMAKGRLATAVKSILAFWMIIMTYVGVNYVLGIGLHSYGFGTGVIAKYVFTIGSIDLALVALCGIAYLMRRLPRPEPA